MQALRHFLRRTNSTEPHPLPNPITILATDHAIAEIQYAIRIIAEEIEHIVQKSIPWNNTCTYILHQSKGILSKLSREKHSISIVCLLNYLCSELTASITTDEEYN